jgi:hypothetical protein
VEDLRNQLRQRPWRLLGPGAPLRVLTAQFLGLFLLGIADYRLGLLPRRLDDLRLDCRVDARVLGARRSDRAA